jgi:hypothetical protein
MNSKHPRVDAAPLKVPTVLRTTIQNIAAKDGRSFSAVAYFLLLKGLKAFMKDGVLVEDEHKFLDQLAIPVITTRQRRSSKQASV